MAIQPDTTAVGRRIRQIRTDLGESQAAFAQRFGVRPSTVSRWESGVSLPTVGHQQALARLGGYPSSWHLVHGIEVQARRVA